MISPGWIALFVVLGIIFISILVGLIINYAAETDCGPKLKFSSFKRFYALNPDRWKLHSDCVGCVINGGMAFADKFYFSFIDYYRYQLWLRRREKNEEKKEEAEIIARMLESVKTDIKNSETLAQHQYKTATNIIQEGWIKYE